MERIRPVLSRLGIPDAGAVSFSSCAPLLACRAAERLPEGAKSVILCLFPYRVPDEVPRNISRYAAGPDYHRIAGGMLAAACRALEKAFPYTFVSFVDNSPIREVDAALRAGLGVLGRNSLLIHPRYGSWTFLGSIVTDMEINYSETVKRACIGCGACVSACPAHCIGEGGVDESRCLSAITQKKGELTPEEAALVKKGDLLWGCDRCQEVCPYNRDREPTPLPYFRDRRHGDFTADEVEQMDDETFSRFAFSWRGRSRIVENLRAREQSRAQSEQKQKNSGFIP